MAVSQTDLQSQVVELSTSSFEAFCTDISSMFEVTMSSEQQQAQTETAKGLEKRFKEFVAVNSVKAEGALSGAFQIVFDREALFTLAGVMVMLPERMILQNRADGSVGDAEAMRETVGETGNLLVGSYDRVFREGLDGHGYFVQTETFIGKPWSKPEEAIGLASDEAFVFVGYDVTIEPYPAFHCGVIFPNSVFESPSESADEQTPSQPESANAEQESTPQDQSPGATEPEPQPESVEKAETQQASAEQSDEAEDALSKEKESEVLESVADSPVETDTAGAVGADESDSADESDAAEQEPQTQDASGRQETVAADESESVAEGDSDNADVRASDGAAEEQSSGGEPEDTPTSVVSETIQRMAESAANLPGESGPLTTVSDSGTLLALRAEQIMSRDVVWATGEDTVQQTLTKMQQHDTGYVLIGTDGVVEGIASRSDTGGAVSVYLRPVFTKWRRPQDDATLDIKIKWVMSRPVRTVSLQASLAVILDNMCRLGGGCLPVVGHQGQVEGIVTVSEIFKVLLRGNSEVLPPGKVS